MQTEDVEMSVVRVNEDCCPICFDNDKELSPLSCPSNHMFCAECIDGYFKTLYINNQTLMCPVCRQEILSNTSLEYLYVREALMRKCQQIHVTVITPTETPNTQTTIPIIRYGRTMQHDAIRRGHAVQQQYSLEHLLLIILVCMLLIAFVIAMTVVVYD